MRTTCVPWDWRCKVPGDIAQREALMIALVDLLAGDAELMELATGGIHRVRAPQGDDAPGADEAYLVVRIMPAPRIVSTLGRPRALRLIRVEIVGFVPGAGSIAGDRIDERIEALVADAVLTLASPWTASKPRRWFDIARSPIIAGREYDEIGGHYQIALSGWSE